MLQLGTLTLEAPAVMGVLNVTPDSFSDGGRFAGVDAAVARAHQLISEGADILDIGAESTRPGAAPVNAEAEWQRLAPVLEALKPLKLPPVSVDTAKADVAAKALAAGASIVNDINANNK